MFRVLKRKLSLAALSVPFLLSGFAFEAHAELPEFDAAYRVTRTIFDQDVTLASAGLRLERSGNDRYRYSSRLNPVRIIAMFYGEALTEVSRGRFTPAGVRPDLYEMRLEGRRPRFETLAFMRDEGEIVQTYKGTETRHRVPEETLDRLSLQLAIVKDLAAGEREMQYLMADQNRLRVYRFEVTGEERVRTPVGEFETLRVELTGRLRVQDAHGMDIDAVETVDDFGGDSRTTFWFAPGLQYLPVRIQHVDDDLGAFRMDIERLQTPL